uniref:Uncharacterized protein n=1 Tax=Tetraselmis chuii TaxID=63592 RepID=A0A6U1KDA9_9CHLO|mmetsp:Transcript_42630/g.76408  ORF Transcript_42630/g.76408 Transcript_42630/m.76408 type:complete len:413 (+) Transcript_42630:1343-2581(+)
MQDARRRQDSVGSASKVMKDRLGGKSKVALGQDQHHLDILPKVLRNYALAAKHGHRLIMQSLPRLLTLWYDFGSGLSDWLATAEGNEESVLEKSAEAVADVMETAMTDVPVYSWLMVLSQLISRMCHRDADVAAVTRQIITRVTEAYPQQSFWSLVPVVRSKYKQRSKAATEIMTRAKRNILASRDGKHKGDGGILSMLAGNVRCLDAPVAWVEQCPRLAVSADTLLFCYCLVLRPGSKCQDLFSQFPALVDQLIALANYIPDQRVRKFDLTREGGLTHVTRMNPDAVILPVLNMLTPELPTNGVANPSHNAFSGRETTIQGIKKEVLPGNTEVSDANCVNMYLLCPRCCGAHVFIAVQVEVMASLQKPKKVVFLGSDGHPYTFLAKPKDDLRKDQRLMELATALNRCVIFI